MLNFSLSPTEAAIVACIFWSKSKNVLRRERTGSAGLSVLLLLMPIDTCMEPWVVSLTPPGPNTFSSGPSEKFMSKMLNACFSLFSNISALRPWK